MIPAELTPRPLDCVALQGMAAVWPVKLPKAEETRSWSSPQTDFWHVHDFNPGTGGETEVLWVTYRPSEPLVRGLEVHWLTEQAVVPLGNQPLIQVLCPTKQDGSCQPDLAQLSAWWIEPGQGLCMPPGCWHTSYAPVETVNVLMLTRRSTTRDLVAQLRSSASIAPGTAHETGFVKLDTWPKILA